MFDIGFWEIALIAVVALLIVGPERFPRLVYQTGLWVGKLRRMLRDVRSDVQRELREHNVAEIETLKRDIEDAGGQFKTAASEFNKPVSAPTAAETNDAKTQTAPESALQYYILRDVRLKRSTIHRGNCRFCNNGRGRKTKNTEPKTQNTIWLGPHEDLANARHEQSGLDGDKRECGVCKPAIPPSPQ